MILEETCGTAENQRFTLQFQTNDAFVLSLFLYSRIMRVHTKTRGT